MIDWMLPGGNGFVKITDCSFDDVFFDTSLSELDQLRKKQEEYFAKLVVNEARPNLSPVLSLRDDPHGIAIYVPMNYIGQEGDDHNKKLEIKDVTISGFRKGVTYGGKGELMVERLLIDNSSEVGIETWSHEVEKIKIKDYEFLNILNQEEAAVGLNIVYTPKKVKDSFLKDISMCLTSKMLIPPIPEFREEMEIKNVHCSGTYEKVSPTDLTGTLVAPQDELCQLCNTDLASACPPVAD